MYVWYGLEKVFPITRISPKSESDWAKTIIWPCGFKSSEMWRIVITFLPTFRGRAVPSSTRARPSNNKKTQRHTIEYLKVGNTAVRKTNLATFDLHFPASLDVTATFSTVSFWVSAMILVWDLLVSFHHSVAGITYKISRFVLWTRCSYLSEL
jgi:hypothetical protein